MDREEPSWADERSVESRVPTGRFGSGSVWTGSGPTHLGADSAVAGTRRGWRVVTTHGRWGRKNTENGVNRAETAPKCQIQSYLGENGHQARRKWRIRGPRSYSGEASNGDERAKRGTVQTVGARGNCWQPRLVERTSDVRRIVPKQLGFRRMLLMDFAADDGLERRVVMGVWFGGSRWFDWARRCRLKVGGGGSSGGGGLRR
ncbi:hypothetical protein V6N11_027026 [Hibiscus sabdariffa]|uniref:Uncharacterized protein n=1 Tax=Hibiscus sabdariffa TaxID=183260 RepID=A0ABR2PGE5_9ROSI